MIPTLLVFGAVFGRWWRSALVIGTVGWVVALLAGDIIDWTGMAAAAAFGLGNTAIGVGLHQAALRGFRAVRRSVRTPSNTAS